MSAIRSCAWWLSGCPMLAAMVRPSAAEEKSLPSSFATRPRKKRSNIWTRCAKSLRNPRFRFVVLTEEPKKMLKKAKRKAAIAGQRQASRIAENPQKAQKGKQRRHRANNGTFSRSQLASRVIAHLIGRLISHPI